MCGGGDGSRSLSWRVCFPFWRRLLMRTVSIFLEYAALARSLSLHEQYRLSLFLLRQNSWQPFRLLTNCPPDSSARAPLEKAPKGLF